tara:strand:- start:102 stop:287 length:186 start_codon:yes stop_codon:yes gene_type:complete
MFENCTLKYIARDGVNISVKVIYPSEGETTKILSVPIDNDNTEYQNILAWVAEGNTIQEAD